MQEAGRGGQQNDLGFGHNSGTSRVLQVCAVHFIPAAFLLCVFYGIVSLRKNSTQNYEFCMTRKPDALHLPAMKKEFPPST